MTRNMGTTDRLVRGLLVAPAAVVAGLLIGPTTVAAIALYVLATIMAATALTGVCVMYRPFHVDTRGRTRHA